jgi:hypothetical protein
VSRWLTPELNADTASAVSLVTLYADGAPEAAELAGRLLDELTSRPDGIARTIGGLVSLCSTLLVLHEFDTGMAPQTVLRRGAIAVQQAHRA